MQVTKRISIIKKLCNFVPRKPLITIYRSFVGPHLDYGDIMYDESCNVFFSNAVAITGMIQGTSQEKIFEELQSLTKYVENSLRNQVKYDIYGKFNSSFCSIFLRYCEIFILLNGEWILGYACAIYSDFPKISLFPKILSLSRSATREATRTFNFC